MGQSQVIQIQHLTKYYGKVIGVRDISFEVHQGEIFGFLGPNGAGKTTAIRLILDLLRPTSGNILMFGLDLPAHSFEIRKRCGYLPGNYSAYGNLTGLEFLHLCADIRKVPRVIETDLLERFELSAFHLSRKIRFLSHGTMQKLGIVQAFFHHPELLILDEPTIGLDPLMQEAFYELLLQRKEEGSTIFISSHNLSEVERICQRMAIIRKGEIEKVDSLENLRKLLKKKLRFTLSRLDVAVDLPGAELVSRKGLTYEYLVYGEIGPVIRALAKLPVEEVILPEPRLEEIFINFYKEGADD
jgi:ABC-2 type transport system ATP-binding protein